jgi:hypothetical protein
MKKLVNLDLAKVLKQKGFDEKCNQIYYDGTDEIRGHSHFLYSRDLKAPTIAEVVMWLYEKHVIWIFTDRTNKWFWTIQKSTSEYIHQEDQVLLTNTVCNGYNSPTEAYEAAITYVLENLI